MVEHRKLNEEVKDDHTRVLVKLAADDLERSGKNLPQTIGLLHIKGEPWYVVDQGLFDQWLTEWRESRRHLPQMIRDEWSLADLLKQRGLFRLRDVVHLLDLSGIKHGPTRSRLREHLIRHAAGVEKTEGTWTVNMERFAPWARDRLEIGLNCHEIRPG